MCIQWITGYGDNWRVNILLSPTSPDEALLRPVDLLFDSRTRVRSGVAARIDAFVVGGAVSCVPRMRHFRTAQKSPYPEENKNTRS